MIIYPVTANSLPFGLLAKMPKTFASRFRNIIIFSSATLLIFYEIRISADYSGFKLLFIHVCHC